MFAALTSKRRLASTLDEAAVLSGDKETSADTQKRTQQPLKGVVACLTGMTPEQKDQYHEWIEALGGRYTRDFQTSRNTHLVAQKSSGGKYEAAMQASSSSIHVVAPSWLEACRTQNCHVDEEEHSWKNTSSHKRKSEEGQSLSFNNKKQKKQKRQLLSSLQHALDNKNNSGHSPMTPTSIFSSCQFYVVSSDSTSEEERTLLGKVMRRGMGTTFWDIHEGITHLIVHDDCSDTIRESISRAKVEFFDETVAIVSPWWILECWEKQNLVSPADFPAQLEKRKKYSISSNNLSKKKKSGETTEKVSNLLRGYLFVMLRISCPPKWMVDYDMKELEKLVRVNGGQILSLKLLEALKSDQASKSQGSVPHAAIAHQGQQQPAKRKCHIICWGGNATANPQQQFALHPLLSQVQRRGLCDCVMVTPNWLQTCVLEQKLVPQTYLPQLFQPQSWPWRRIVVPSSSDNAKNNSDEKNKGGAGDGDGEDSSSPSIRVSVTGFTGHRRTAIIQAIQAMGASYDDSMRQHITTHLICADQAANSKHNQKFQKAIEWGIHIVSVEWLYHILQHGVKKSDHTNCDEKTHYYESRFSLVSSRELDKEE